MTELINGDGSVVLATSGYTRHTISSSTNATPIEVTFGGAHGSNEGDTWEIEGHTTNTAANGTWRVHVVSSTKLELIGSVGSGVGGATGYGVDYSLNPLIQVPDDGDAASGANLNTATSGVFNFVPFLFQRVGQFRILEMVVGASGTPFSTTAGTVAMGTSYVDLGIGPFSGNYVFQVGDFLIVNFSGAVFQSSTVEMNIVPGLAINGGAAAAQDTYGVDLTPSGTNTAPDQISFTALITTASEARTWSLSLMGKAASGGPYSLSWRGQFAITVFHLRGNG